MISKLKKTNEIPTYSDVALNNFIVHAGNLCFSVFLIKGIYNIKQKISNDVYKDDCYIVIRDINGKNIAFNYGIGNEDGFSLQILENGIYLIYSNFRNNINAIKTIIINPSPLSFSENNTEDHYKFNSFNLQEIYGKTDNYSMNEWEEIQLKNEETNFLTSNDVPDNRYPINNMIDGNDGTYTVFSAIENTTYNEVSEKDNINIMFSFPNKTNICYIMIDHITESEEFKKFRWNLVLSGSDDKKTWKKINTIYPGFKHKVIEENNISQEDNHSLYVVDDLNEQFDMVPISTNDEYGTTQNWVIVDTNIIYNPLNQRYLFNFRNDNSYKYYQLDFKAIKNDYEEQSKINHSFKIRHLKCFSKNSKNSPIAKFIFSKNANESNNWVNFDATSISFSEIENKQCAEFSNLLNSHIRFSKLFLSNKMDGLTVSLFFYIPLEKMNDYEKHIFVSKHYWDIGFFNNEVSEKISLFSHLCFDGLNNDDIILENIFEISKEEFCNKWHHVSFTFKNGIFLMYFDSELVSKSLYDGEIKYIKDNNIFYNTYVGCEIQNEENSNALIHFFNGYIRELAFYKEALLKQQIRQIYLKGI